MSGMTTDDNYGELALAWALQAEQSSAVNDGYDPNHLLPRLTREEQEFRLKQKRQSQPEPPLVARGNWEGVVPPLPPPSAPSGPLRLLKGEMVEYYSTSYESWIPTTISKVDEETGAISVECKPERQFKPREQANVIRPRTRPDRQRLDWLRMSVREGRVDEEAEALFGRYSQRCTGTLHEKSFRAVGNEIDHMLGVCGSICGIRDAAEQRKSTELNYDDFSVVFHKMVWSVQKVYAKSLEKEACVTQQSGNPKAAYDFQKKLGQGTYGTVYLAVSRATNAKRAIKSMRKDSVEENMDPEIDYLCELDHPHIVKIYEYFDSGNHIYIVMDFCSGGELAAVIQSHDRSQTLPEESFVSVVMMQILSAITYVHARGLMHLDLKSQNVMLMPSRRTMAPSENASGQTLALACDRPHVIVIDLGIAQVFKPGNFKHNDPRGTPATMAPEVWKGVLTPKADVFSLGVMLFEMLSLSYPFNLTCDIDQARIFWQSPPDAPWQRIRRASDDAIQMCQTMLQYDRLKRPTASECFKFEFVASEKDCGHMFDGKREAYLKRLLNFPERSELQKSVALIIARQWPANQLPTVSQIFQELDADGTGHLKQHHLQKALADVDVDASRGLAIADAVDLSGDGVIEWSEFVAACLDLSSPSLDADLQRLFQSVDSDEDGYLVKEDVAKLLASDNMRGKITVEDAFFDLVGERSHRNKVDFQKFRRYFASDNMAAASDSGSKDVYACPSSPVRVETPWASKPVFQNQVKPAPGGYPSRDPGNPTLFDQACELMDKVSHIGFGGKEPIGICSSVQKAKICQRGHQMFESDKFCNECGAAARSVSK